MALMGRKAKVELLAHQETEATLDDGVPKVPKARQEMWARLVYVGIQAQQATTTIREDLRETRAMLGHRESLAKMAGEEVLENQGDGVLMVGGVHLDKLELLEGMVKVVFLENLESEGLGVPVDQSVPQELGEKTVILDPEVLEEHKDHLERRADEELLAARGNLVTQDLKVLWDHWDPEENLEMTAEMDSEYPAQKEERVMKVSLDILVQREQPVSLEPKENLDLKETVDREALLVEVVNLDRRETLVTLDLMARKDPEDRA